MKYFLDTEFHEYHLQPKFFGIKTGKAIPTIDLISIGIVNEDGQHYYAVCSEFDLDAAWFSNQGTESEPNYWLRENVLKDLFRELSLKLPLLTGLIADDFEELWEKHPKSCRGWLRQLIIVYGKTKKEIADDIVKFTNDYSYYKVIAKEGEETGDVLFYNTMDTNVEEWIKDHPDCMIIPKDPIEFYAYFADYDWVVFAQLYGKMIDLPDGFPYYCRDLKQMLDEKKTVGNLPKSVFIGEWDNIKIDFKKHPDYPTQDNEHNALDDAKWNLNLYKFLKSL